MAVFFCTASCAPTYVVVKLDRTQLAACNLTIMPFFNSTINFPGSVEKILGKGRKDSLIVSFFEQAVAANLSKTSCFRSVKWCGRQAAAVVGDSVRVKNAYTGIWRPAGRLPCAEAGDLVLFVYNAALDSATVEYKEQDVVFSQTTLNFSADYVYLKADSGRVVSFGKIQENYVGLVPAVERTSFEKLAEKISNVLLAGGNYSKR
ncbi:MAG TPA: hypothetical protein VLX68_13565 [Chitinivibrionales bacterium]|nr:hypothetical protein [Chitinivibrionales bacterium]